MIGWRGHMVGARQQNESPAPFLLYQYDLRKIGEQVEERAFSSPRVPSELRTRGVKRNVHEHGSGFTRKVTSRKLERSTPVNGGEGLNLGVGIGHPSPSS